MAAYNEIDGVYCHGNPWLLTDLLRGEYGFGGFVMSDGVAIDQLDAVTGDRVASGALALNSGVDMGLWDTAFSFLEEAVEKGLVEESRIDEAFITPTLKATPGDLSLVLPKRILDGIIEMIYALDKVAPGTANDDTLLYGVEVKFYNMEVEVNAQLESCYPGLYIIGDGSGITHSLSHASASGVHVARSIAKER